MAFLYPKRKVVFCLIQIHYAVYKPREIQLSTQIIKTTLLFANFNGGRIYNIIFVCFHVSSLNGTKKPKRDFEYDVKEKNPKRNIVSCSFRTASIATSGWLFNEKLAQKKNTEQKKTIQQHFQSRSEAWPNPHPFFHSSANDISFQLNFSPTHSAYFKHTRTN